MEASVQFDTFGDRSCDESGGQERRRILFVVQRFHTNLWEATRALSEAQIEVSIWGEGRGNAEDHSIVTPRLFSKDASSAELRAAWNAEKPDLVIVRNVSPHRRAVAELARMDRVPMWFYDLRPYHWREPLRRLLRRRLEGLPTRRITPVLGLDSSTLPNRATRHIPWPVIAAPDAPEKTQEGAVTVLCVAKLYSPRKNHSLVIDALRAHGRGGNVRLLVAGTTGESEKYAQEIAALEDVAAREPWLELHANVPFRDMPKLYMKSDICILPSVCEPLGFAPLEAMAYGCVPVISTDAGSAGYVRHGENGMHVNVERSGAVQEVFEKLLSDSFLRLRLGAAARRTAQSELSAENFILRIRALMCESGIES